MTQRTEQTMPWVIVAPTGVYWLGHAHGENSAWTIALGWPDAEEVAEHKRASWYAAEATVTWKRPTGVGVDAPASTPEQPCWLVERRAEGRTTGYLGHANGSYEWMPTPDKATRFVRREDANGVAECIETEDVIVAEHIWG